MWLPAGSELSVNVTPQMSAYLPPPPCTLLEGISNCNLIPWAGKPTPWGQDGDLTVPGGGEWGGSGRVGTGDTWLPQKMDLGASTLFFLGRAGTKAEPTWAPPALPHEAR